MAAGCRSLCPALQRDFLLSLCGEALLRVHVTGSSLAGSGPVLRGEAAQVGDGA